jgi:hypothetical protein
MNVQRKSISPRVKTTAKKESHAYFPPEST